MRSFNKSWPRKKKILKYAPKNFSRNYISTECAKFVIMLFALYAEGREYIQWSQESRTVLKFLGKLGEMFMWIIAYLLYITFIFDSPSSEIAWSSLIKSHFQDDARFKFTAAAAVAAAGAAAAAAGAAAAAAAAAAGTTARPDAVSLATAIVVPEALDVASRAASRVFHRSVWWNNSCRMKFFPINLMTAMSRYV